MAKDPAFSFYAQDFILDTMQWTRAAKGLHCELLAIAWINGYIEANESGEPMELDEDGIKLWRTRVSKKWVLQDGRLYNSKLEETRAARKKFKDGQAEKGRKSAEKRSTAVQPEVNHGSTTVEPGIPVEPFEKEKEKEYEEEREYENEKLLVPQMLMTFKVAIPTYPDDRERDSKALLSIAAFLCKRGNLRGAPEHNAEPILEAWEQISANIREDRFYCQKSLYTISNHIQEIVQKALHGDKSKPLSPIPGGKLDDEKLKAAIAKRTGGR